LFSFVNIIVGRNIKGQGDYPCRVNAVPRPIPDKKWFLEPYFIFTSFWAYKIYYVYGFMLLVVLILSIVTMCVTVVCTYFLLNAEDYRWSVSSLHFSCHFICLMSGHFEFAVVDNEFSYQNDI
uniref:Transmembrane 9 superfamily member n=1 Tax=Parascaris equorum TaxID=6256 RepID=A0A914RWW9_PAREQ